MKKSVVQLIKCELYQQYKKLYKNPSTFFKWADINSESRTQGCDLLKK